jgi:transcriptional regulator with XRE-family HTH domain
MDFAELLRKAMGDMSQADLADASGLRQATISRYLSGERKPTYDAMLALEKALPTLRGLRESAAA